MNESQYFKPSSKLGTNPVEVKINAERVNKPSLLGVNTKGGDNVVKKED